MEKGDKRHLRYFEKNGFKVYLSDEFKVKVQITRKGWTAHAHIPINAHLVNQYFACSF